MENHRTQRSKELVSMARQALSSVGILCSLLSMLSYLSHAFIFIHHSLCYLFFSVTISLLLCITCVAFKGHYASSLLL